MTAASALLAAVIFLLALRRARVGRSALEAAALAREAFASLSAPDRSDEQKARLARRHSLGLLKQFGRITGRFLAAAAAPALLLLALDAAGISRWADAWALLAKWETTVAAGAAAAAAALFHRRRAAA